MRIAGNISRLSAIVLVAATLSGCGTSRQVSPAGIQTRARQGYFDGLADLESGNYTEALRHFHTVAAGPAYFRYTALAALRAADSLFYHGQYAAAIEAYQGFVKQFAGNPNIPYAEFRVAQCHFERIPGDWWFMPPAYEKDLATTRAAYEAFARFTNRYPRHRFAPAAHEMRLRCAKRLFDYEMYVADFHEAEDKPRGVALRLETALARYPEHALTETTLIRLAATYAELGDGAATRDTLVRYLAVFPEGKRRAEVLSWLEQLEKRPPAPASEDMEDGATAPLDTDLERTEESDG